MNSSILTSYPLRTVSYPLAFLIALCQYVDMECIYCASTTHVTNSRPQKRLMQVWRRRACKHCQAIFTTIETVDLTGSLVVKQPDSSVAPFSRDTLFVSIYNALGHRTDAVAAANALTATIIARLRKSITGAIVSRGDLIAIASEVLKHFDAAAVVQYAAYHPSKSKI